MIVREIIEHYLKEHGYDGLVGDECGCFGDDICPCDDNTMDCVPGYKVPADSKMQMLYDCEWMMSTTKPDKKGV